MSGTNIDADLLYYSRGEDNSSYRPVLTGDVYENLLLPGSTGTERNRTVIILQHPCSMRTNGVDLVWHILAAGLAVSVCKDGRTGTKVSH